MEEDLRKRVMFMQSWSSKDMGRAITYRIGCSCSESDHDIVMWLEYDKKLKDVAMFFYKQVEWCNYGDSFKDRMEGYWRRIKDAIKLIFTGYLECETSFIFEDSEHIDNFINTMEKAKQYVEEGEKKNVIPIKRH